MERRAVVARRADLLLKMDKLTERFAQTSPQRKQGNERRR
jgi:hypothetical protein